MDLEEIESLYEQEKESAQKIWDKGLEQGKKRYELQKAYQSQIKKVRKKYYDRMTKYIKRNKERPKSKKEPPKQDEENKKKGKSKFIESIKNIWGRISFSLSVKKSALKTSLISPSSMYKIAKVKYYLKRGYKAIKKIISQAFEKVFTIIKTLIGKISSFFGKSYIGIVTFVKKVLSKIKKGFLFVYKKTEPFRILFRKKEVKKEEPKKEEPQENQPKE